MLEVMQQYHFLEIRFQPLNKFHEDHEIQSGSSDKVTSVTNTQKQNHTSEMQRIKWRKLTKSISERHELVIIQREVFQ